MSLLKQTKSCYLVFFFIMACSSQSADTEIPKKPSMRQMFQELIPPAQLTLPANWGNYTEEQKKSWRQFEQVQIQILQKQHRFSRDKEIYQQCWGYLECDR